MIRAVEAKHPSSVGQLAEAVAAESELSEEDFIKTIKDMAGEGSLTLSRPKYELESAWDYLFTVTLSAPLWGTVGLAVLTVLSVAFIPDLFPINVVRWVLGSIFVLYLPGYTLLKLLFPQGGELDGLERFALSIGLSLALVPLIGLVLNYTRWGIRLGPVVASLSAFTLLLAVAAAVRSYRREQTPPRVRE